MATRNSERGEMSFTLPLEHERGTKPLKKIAAIKTSPSLQVPPP